MPIIKNPLNRMKAHTSEEREAQNNSNIGHVLRPHSLILLFSRRTFHIFALHSVSFCAAHLNAIYRRSMIARPNILFGGRVD